MTTQYDFMRRESQQPGYGAGAQSQQNNYAMPARDNNPYGASTSMGGGAQPVRTGGLRGPAPTTRPGAAGAGTFSLYGGNQQYSIRSGSPGQTGPGSTPGGSAQPGQQQQTPTQNPGQHGTSQQPGQQQQYQGAGAPSYGGNGQTYPNPDPYGSPYIDYMNADGSPHINYQYGQNSGGGGGQPGPTGPNGGSNTYWQNPSAGQQPGRDPRYPNDRGPMPIQQGGYSGAPGGQGLPFTWDQYNQARNDNPRIAQEWAQMALPYQQLAQNSYQYDRDFGESVRRDDRNYGLTYDQQRYDQTMNTRQQYMAEQAQQTASNQWDQQFGWTQHNDRFNQDMAYQDFTRSGQQWDQQFAQSNNQFDRNFALQQTGQNQQYGLDRDSLALQQQQAGWGQQNAQQGLYLQGQAQALDEIRNQQQYGLSQNSQAMQAQQMAHQMGIDTRGMTLQEVAQAAQQAYQQQQLAQTATLSREQMASQERQAVMAATGRQAAPAAKWVRSW